MPPALARPSLSQLYARHAARWHESITHLGYPEAYALLAETDMAARQEPPRYVLDAGCGSGAFAEQVIARCPSQAHLTLLDPSEEMLAQARKRDWREAPETVSGRLQDISALPRRFDTVLCAHVLEHTADLEASLRQLAQALTPGGSLLLAVSKPHWCTAILRWRWGHKAYQPDDICAALARAGLTGINAIRFIKGPPSRTSCGYRAIKPG
ncbi:class I SAM-dependent methyltransferase [Ruegeria sp. 2205SS24-7]|uniref:class I SAM-dependent methyltransferase n=1 Tax=Ruegeria discodermiae TaxID=3064389 RepID=UPI002742025B|nr:class I SAM-dependent methyltransferase [Ruegeria sp. 2205SS24-7]MDP5216553.1 class I SAM-dependent methyltransferase [Ruegeria sp. 2205SS24-7]